MKLIQNYRGYSNILAMQIKEGNIINEPEAVWKQIPYILFIIILNRK